MYSAALLLGIGLFAAALPQAPAKQLDGVYNIPLRRIDDNNGYGMEVGVGTPPQMVTLLVDTGSNTYSVESSGMSASKRTAAHRILTRQRRGYILPGGHV